MRIISILVVFLSSLGTQLHAQGAQTVADARSHLVAELNWMRVGQYVPEMTDRLIIPIGTQESHGVDPVGTDAFIPTELAERMWENLNAFIAPPVHHGVSGLGIGIQPGAVYIRPEVFTDYMEDILRGYYHSGFRTFLIINGHGGNTSFMNEATQRVYLDHKDIRVMQVQWWEIGGDRGDPVSFEVYGGELHTPGHAAQEETALLMGYDYDLVDKELYESLGRDVVAREGYDGISVLPATSTMVLYRKGTGYINWDNEKANRYTQGMADYIADKWLDAIQRWDRNAELMRNLK